VLFLPPYHRCSNLVGKVAVELLVVVHLVVVDGVDVFVRLVVSGAGGWLLEIVVEVLLGFLPPLLVFLLYF